METDRTPPKNAKLTKELRDWAGVSVLLVIVWAVLSYLNGEVSSFWPVIPIGIWGALIAVTRLASN